MSKAIVTAIVGATVMPDGATVMPEYIAIHNEVGALFASTMTGCTHRQPERDYLQQLHAVAVLG